MTPTPRPRPPIGSARRAARTAAARIPTDLKPDDFYGYMLEHRYIFAPTGEIWPASSVDARLPVGRQYQGLDLDRPEPRRRADDLGAGPAGGDR